MRNMRKQTSWITTTAILLALLIVLQAVTRAGGQFLTGSCVNLLLAVAALAGGLWCGITVAILSPFFAFLLGIGPALFLLTPCIALGNLVFVVLLALMLSPKRKNPIVWRYGAVLIAAFAKFLTLWIVIVQFAIPALGLPEKQASVMSAMFSWPQLVTALIGGCIAATIMPLLRKALKRAPMDDSKK